MLRLCVIAGCLFGLLAACGSDGTTPDCPELPRYDIREPLSAETLAKLRAAAAKGCVTLPAGETNSGGAAGAGGAG